MYKVKVDLSKSQLAKLKKKGGKVRLSYEQLSGNTHEVEVDFGSIKRMERAKKHKKGVDVELKKLQIGGVVEELMSGSPGAALGDVAVKGLTEDVELTGNETPGEIIKKALGNPIGTLIAAFKHLGEEGKPKLVKKRVVVKGGPGNNNPLLKGEKPAPGSDRFKELLKGTEWENWTPGQSDVISSEEVKDGEGLKKKQAAKRK